MMAVLDSLPWFVAPLLALAAGLLALAPLGAHVLARGVVFIDLAVAQAAAAGALAVAMVAEHPESWLTAAGALAGALLCVAAVAGLVRRAHDAREAMIGLLYVLGASVAMLAARLDPHGPAHLTQLLAADVLWAGWTQVGTLCGLATVSLVAWRGGWLQRDSVFYLCFAWVASLAVAILGLFVVFAALIVPALWHRAGMSLLGAVGLTGLAAGLGLLASWHLDGPSGACVALALAACGLASIMKRKTP